MAKKQRKIKNHTGSSRKFFTRTVLLPNGEFAVNVDVDGLIIL